MNEQMIDNNFIFSLSRLQRYVSRLWLQYVFVVTSILVLVLILLYTSEVLSDIAGGRLPISILGWQVLLHIPDALRTVAPLGLVVGVLLASGQLQQDGEWVQLNILGLSPRRRLWVLLRVGLMVSLVLLLVTSLILPAAERFKQNLLETAASSAEFWGLQAGRFTTLPDQEGVLYVAEIDENGAAENVFVSWKNEQGEQVLTSDAGNFRINSKDGARYVTMRGGRRTVIDEQGQMQLLDFGAAEIKLPTPAINNQDEPLTAWSWTRVWGTNSNSAVAEAHWRLAHPLCAIILVLWAYAFMRTRGEHQGWSILLLVLIYVVYSNMLNLGNIWLLNGQMNRAFGLWWVHLTMLLPAIWLVFWRMRQT